MSMFIIPVCLLSINFVFSVRFLVNVSWSCVSFKWMYKDSQSCAICMYVWYIIFHLFFFLFWSFFRHFQLPVHVHVLISLIKANWAVIFMLEIFIILFPTFFLKDKNYMINILLLIIFLWGKLFRGLDWSYR